MTERKVIGPASRPQELFLTLRDGTGPRSRWANEDGEEVDIIIYGGAMGGGKSHAALIHHLKYIHIPYYKGIIIRRTTPMLMRPGSIWDEARALYKEVDPAARIRFKDMKISFGPIKDREQQGEVSFAHFERADNTDNYQGSQLSSAVMDELTQFEESQFLYILSRLRTKAEMKPVIRGTCNPDPDSWVRRWIDWYLYPKDHELFGRPDPEKQGVVRWFIRLNNEMIWDSSRDIMFEKYGVKDSAGNLLPDDHPKQIKPLSFAFVSASIYDNPYAEANYIGFLEGLDRISKERNLYGSWEARESSSGYWKREWCEVINLPPSRTVQQVRAWDISGTLPSDTNPNPDWTVGTLMSKDKNSIYYVEDVVRDRRRYGGVFELILETARRDGTDTKIVIPRDPGAAGQAYASDIIRQLAEYGFAAKSHPTNKSKVQRFAPFAALCEAGGVRIVKGSWNDTFMLELERFDGSRSVKDDIVDSTSDAFSELASNIHIPDFTLPDMSRNNPYKMI